MSTTVAAIILVVVVVIGGVGAYAGLSSVGSSKTTRTGCSGITCPKTSSGTNDVTLFVPYTVGYGQTYSQVAVGTSVQATVGVTNGETVKSFAITWAPGVTTTNAEPTLSYSYGQTGLFTISAQATDTAGTVHTGLSNLVVLKVNPSAANITLGYYPTVSATFKNGTGGVYPFVGVGGTVTVNGTYTAAPNNPLYVPTAPTLTTPSGSSQSNYAHGTNYASATYSFSAAGNYAITLVVPVTGPNPKTGSGTATLYENYTWGVFVGASGTTLGCTLCKAPTEASPHAGDFVNYEVVPGGALDLDPAADYYSVGYELGQSFDESLIYLNGTDSGPTYQNFVPGVATCVPGSPLCTKLYGQTLVKGSNYTFVIDPAAHFYDPTTKVGREVYPTDVMFTIMRTIFYTQLETFTGYYVGFDMAGPLIPYAGLSPQDVNASWDIGPGSAPVHYPYNNTPYWMYNSMSINDSAYCPLNAGNGCITFHANADGASWPAILLILSIISADGIQEAGWYTSQGANVPGFVCSSTNVDLPCLLPGSQTSTNTTLFHNAVNALSPTAFDAQEEADINYPVPVPSVAWSEVGSGPYYLAYANSGVGYVLEKNPYYQAPTGCAGQVGCLPLPSGFVPKVTTFWEASDTTGIEEFEAGYADTAVFESPEFGTMLSLLASGQLGLIDFPTLTTDNYGFNTYINTKALASYYTGKINIPPDALAHVGLRATLEYAYPYTTAQSEGNFVKGIDAGSPYGGFLPPAESAFYNYKTPWPNYNNLTFTFSNPVIGQPTTMGTASWYWTQATTSGSLYYDPELAGFSSSNPLIIPIVGFTSAPNINAVELSWGESVKNITGGVVQFAQFFLPSTTPEYAVAAPGVNPWPIWWFGWIPDYPAPVNNWQGAYGSTGLWGAADALSQTWIAGDWGGDYNDSSCGHYGNTIANLTYWADEPGAIIPEKCQGTALNVTLWGINQATYTSNSAYSVSTWYLVQDVYNNLQLSVGNDAQNTVFDYAPWINPASINTNVMIGGGTEWAFYQLAGNGIV